MLKPRDYRHYAGQGSCSEIIRKCIEDNDCHCADLPPECRKACEKELIAKSLRVNRKELSSPGGE